MQDFIRYVILGIPVGCVFALVAVGLVLTFKTSGVFNLAFAAQAYLAAAVYYDVHVRHEWPIIPAFVFAVFVVSPLLGFILDRFVFRWLRGVLADRQAGLRARSARRACRRSCRSGSGRARPFGIKGIWWDDNALYHFGDYTLDGRQMAILVSTAVVVLLLVALFRWTAIGLQMRAVVESPRLTELAGVNADRASSAAWMLSSTMAGLAGVLLAPFSASLNVGDFTTLLVSAIAAAAFARLTSIPMALLGGILLGIAQALLNGLPAAGEHASPRASSRRCRSRCCSSCCCSGPGCATGGRSPTRCRAPTRRRRRSPSATRSAAVHPLHAHPRRRCSSRSSCYIALVRADDVLALAAHAGARVLRDLPVDHGHHRHGRPDLAVPGDVRGHRRGHDRAVRRARSARTCCSG